MRAVARHVEDACCGQARGGCVLWPGTARMRAARGGCVLWLGTARMRAVTRHVEDACCGQARQGCMLWPGTGRMRALSAPHTLLYQRSVCDAARPGVVPLAACARARIAAPPAAAAAAANYAGLGPAP
eukprot:366496-Chlamydomonas_euryale.AAC.18